VRELLLRGFLCGLLPWLASQPSGAAETLGDDEFAIDFGEGPSESASARERCCLRRAAVARADGSDTPSLARTLFVSACSHALMHRRGLGLC